MTSAAPVTLSIIVPVFNEKNTFLQLFEKVYALDIPGKEIIVVDDFSTDGTRDLLKGLEGRPGVTVVLHEKNGGKGTAIRTGLAHAKGDVVVPQDSDLELDPTQIITLLQFFKDKNADAVFGTRFRKAAFSLNKYFLANYLLSLFTSMLYFQRITDMETCYKMVKRDVLLSLKLKSARFDIEPEVTGKLSKRGIRIHELPIKYNPRTEAEGKKIKLKDAFSAVWTLIKYRFVD